MFEYIAKDSPAMALSYIDKLENTITSLQENPNYSKIL
jgi:plasmid stabilization system protein ParE